MRFTSIFVFLMAGCSSTPEADAPRPLQDFRGIIHCHSKFSHDSKGSYEEILAAAKAAKVDFVCMTDHPPSDDKGLPLREGWTGLHDGVLFIQGAEYSDQILGLGLKEPVTGKDRRETIRAIHRQGGVAIACHPEEIDDWDAFAEADGMEIYNVHAALKAKMKEKGFLIRVAKELKEDPEHSFRLLQDLDPAILRRWEEINKSRPFVGIAGNDAHQNVNIFGLQVDPYPRAFKFVATHVLATELTQEGILGGIQAGRCYVRFWEEQAPVQAGPGLEWIGQEIQVGTWIAEPELTPVGGFGPLVSRWFRDGQPCSPGHQNTLARGATRVYCIRQWSVPEPGRVRYEIDQESGAPVLLTNPARFTAKSP